MAAAGMIEAARCYLDLLHATAGAPEDRMAALAEALDRLALPVTLRPTAGRAKAPSRPQRTTCDYGTP
jgi:hypothetical protein